MHSVSVSHYEVLNIIQDASEVEIKKVRRFMCRKLALQYHPDKNPNNPTAAERFKEISIAYEVLSNRESRIMYDRYGGKDMPEQTFDAHDFFAHFFGSDDDGDHGEFMFNIPGRGSRPSRPTVQRIEMSCTLEELYNGKVMQQCLEKMVICHKCNGIGGDKATARKTCITCKGRGITAAMRSAGGGTYTQTQEQCRKCDGTGMVFPTIYQCKRCHGKRVVKQKKTVKIIVERGMTNGSKINLRGEADQEPGFPPGDVVIVITEKIHEKFVRHNNDLKTNLDISLRDALCGFERFIQHLDGRFLRILHPRGRVIKPNDTKCIIGEGMPRHGCPSDKGNLYIQFNIEFPPDQWLDFTQLNTFETLLPNTSSQCADERPKSESDMIVSTTLVNESSSYDDHDGWHTDEDDDNDNDSGMEDAQVPGCATQ